MSQSRPMVTQGVLSVDLCCGNPGTFGCHNTKPLAIRHSRLITFPLFHVPHFVSSLCVLCCASSLKIFHVGGLGAERRENWWGEGQRRKQREAKADFKWQCYFTQPSMNIAVNWININELDITFRALESQLFGHSVFRLEGVFEF